MRAKNIQVADVQAHAYNGRQKRAIDAYLDARNSGMQPDSLFPSDVAKARKITDATGVPYRGDQPTPLPPSE
jgi:hypothetical protein